ncbi:MAG: hypothetical protein R6V56_01050, partial [Lentisphaeria bacterium]
MRIVIIMLGLVFPAITIAQGAIDEIHVTSHVTFSTPVGTVTRNIVLIQDQNGFLSRRVLAASNSEGVSALSSAGGQTFYTPQISFKYQDLSFFAGDLVEASEASQVRADDLNAERPFSRSDGIAAVSVEVDALYLVPARTVSISGFTASTRTVIKSQNGTSAPYFDGDAAGIPDDVTITALEILNGGELLLSFDRSFAWNELTIRPGDVVWHDG